MYVCMHVCMYICMYTYTEFFFSRAYTFGGGSTLCVWERERECVCMRQHARMCVSLSLCASCLSIYLFICWFSYVFIYLFIYLPTFEEGMRDMEWLHTHTHTHTHTNSCVNTYILIYQEAVPPLRRHVPEEGVREFSIIRPDLHKKQVIFSRFCSFFLLGGLAALAKKKILKSQRPKILTLQCQCNLSFVLELLHDLRDLRARSR